MESVMTKSRSGGYFALKKMGERMGEGVNNDINLPCHDGMSNFEIAEDIANHFSEVSNEY